MKRDKSTSALGLPTVVGYDTDLGAAQQDMRGYKARRDHVFKNEWVLFMNHFSQVPQLCFTTSYPRRATA